MVGAFFGVGGFGENRGLDGLQIEGFTLPS